MQNFKEYQETLSESVDVKSKLDKLMEKLTAKFSADSQMEYKFTKGKKYYRIFKQHKNDNMSGSAWGFSDMDGNLYKAAGWKAPAKGIRGTVDELLARNLTNMEEFSFGSLR